MSSPKTREVNLSRIPPEKRQEAWERLQEKYPAQAALLEDPFFVGVRKAFPNGEVFIELPAD